MPDPSETATQEVKEGILSQSDAISLSLTEDKAKEVIGKRIDNGIRFWDKELKLKDVREENEKRWANKNREVSGQNLYDYQNEFRDNRIFVSIETLVANTVARLPVPEVTEANDTEASRELAENYGKVLFRKADDMYLKGTFQMVARHLLMGYRLGVAKTFWDESAGRLKEDGTYTGDVVVKYVRPHRIVLDEEADDPDNVPLIAENMTATVEEIGWDFPDKKDELIKKAGASKGKGSVLMGTKLGYYEVFFSFFDEDGVQREGVAWKYEDLLLDWGINPNFNYDSDDPSKSNFLEKPAKPYVLFTFLSTGKYAIDQTSLTEQAASQQDILEKRGTQTVDAGDQSMATNVFNTMQVDAKDAKKYISDPKQSIMAKGDVRTAFKREPALQLPKWMYEDKLDARREIDNIMGTHAPMRGERTTSPTLGQEVLSQRSDLGRGATLGGSIEKGALQVYKQMTQILKVFAEEEHIVKYLGRDTGTATHIAFSRDKIEDGVELRIQTGSMSPDDKLTDRTEAVELAKTGGRIDPLTFAEKWHIDKPREFAKRVFYFLFMPDTYAKEILGIGETGGDQEAMQTIQRINSGENVPPKQNPTKEYIAYYGQYIESPAFKQLDSEIQGLHIQHIKGTIEGAKGELSGKGGGKKPGEGIVGRFTNFFRGK